MKKVILFLLLPAVLLAQGLNFDSYKTFLNQNQNLTSLGLSQMYPPGLYKSKANLLLNQNLYLDSVKIKFSLTDNELGLLNKNGFVVTERVSYNNFSEAIEDIWKRDLPIFITTDLILQTIHVSYDAILKNLEQWIIIWDLKNSLDNLQNNISSLLTKYGNDTILKKSVNDLDVYFTVARCLLNGKDSLKPQFTENQKIINEILLLIDSLQPADYRLFCDTTKQIDFSQFKVRGHYNDEPYLGNYFRAMIWLGRIEFYLTKPQPEDLNPQTDTDIQRQIIDAVMINELCNQTKVTATLDTINSLITAIVGESDNVQLKNINELISELSFQDAKPLTQMENCKKLQDLLATKAYTDQKILSQMLWKYPFDTTVIKSTSAFMLMGQRFIIDSYILGNLVWDKVIPKDKSIPLRMLPSSLDVLFVLGNNGAGDLLKPEIDKYRYAPNIAALRYLVDSYDSTYWSSSYYNGWMNTIRTLNPPSDSVRDKLPHFMRTAAWWQEKMNTQLASWTQLRHDNLLYTKQSYTRDASCSYPLAFLEPIPEFYHQLVILSQNGIDFFSNIKYGIGVKYYFDTLNYLSKNFYDISLKEINNQNLSENDLELLRRVFSSTEDCIVRYDGWYYKLLYDKRINSYNADDSDFVVADIHTSATDEFGDMVGWVKHVGVGKINLLVANVETPDGNSITYCGPVMSYYEHTTTNFQRLTDEEWATLLNDANTLKPPLVNLYMANNAGSLQTGEQISLPTGVQENPITGKSDSTFFSFPNPFSTYTNIAVSLSNNIDNQLTITIYNTNGELVKELFSGSLFGGNYIFRWDGTDRQGKQVESGVYLYGIKVNGKAVQTKKMNVVR